MAIDHLVCFKFEPPIDRAQQADLRAALSKWPEEIGGFSALRFGRTTDSSRSSGYDLILRVEFVDEAALRHYQDHPVHLAFAERTRMLGASVIVIDLDLDEATIL